MKGFWMEVGLGPRGLSGSMWMSFPVGSEPGASRRGFGWVMPLSAMW